MPIIEPEVDIHSPEKAEAEELLRAGIAEQLDQLDDTQHVMLKLTLPDEDDFYTDFVDHPKVLRVVALSGGYSREEADARLARNHGVIASFSRALTEGLTAQQTRRGVRRRAGQGDRRHLRRVEHLIPLSLALREGTVRPQVSSLTQSREDRVPCCAGAGVAQWQRPAA